MVSNKDGAKVLQKARYAQDGSRSRTKSRKIIIVHGTRIVDQDRRTQNDGEGTELAQ